MNDLRWQLVPLVLALAAAVTFIVGPEEAAMALVLLSVGTGFVVELTRRRRTKQLPPPEITPEQAAEVREERERAGEVRAVKRLRTLHPQLSLSEAVRRVRNL